MLYTEIAQPGEKCPIFKDKVSKKSITVMCNIEDAPEVREELTQKYNTKYFRYYTTEDRKMVAMRPVFY